MKALFALILVFTVSYGIGQYLKKQQVVENKSKVYSSDCNPVNTNCLVVHNGIEYGFQFKDAPSPLTPFAVQLIVTGLKPDSVEIEFEMEGMDMGYNTHQLIQDKLTWHAEVLLPVCSLGRNDWTVNVKLKVNDKLDQTVFSFTQLDNEM